MNVVVGADARDFRRAVGVVAWSVLEELLLDAHIDDGALVAHTNVRAIAARLGVSKDTAARAIGRLARASVVQRVVAERGARGALPMSSYRVDVARVVGLAVDEGSSVAPAIATTSTDPRRATRVTRRVDDAQTSLFELPASTS